MRRAFAWTELQNKRLAQVQEVLDELSAYLPLTLRQIYYQLVGKGYIENRVSQYGMLSKLLKHARIDGFIAWHVIEDRVRAMRSGAGWDDKKHFVNSEMRNFLHGYRRDLMQSQNKFIEVWIEKDALSRVFGNNVLPYCISVVVCRGFSSVSFLHDFVRRLSYVEDKQPVMLYFGDFDPSGCEMLDAMQTTLEDEICIGRGVEFKRIALTKEDIFEHNLPHNPNALKHTDTRAAKHVAEHGDLAVELDALPPAILEKKIHAAIENEIDMSLFEDEKATEEVERHELDELRNDVRGQLDIEDE